jgi:hypothetical protein
LVEQFHKVQFFFNEDEQSNVLNIYNNIEITSNANELYAKDGDGGFSLYLGDSYLCLDFDTHSKRICNFGGTINLNNLKIDCINLPKDFLKGILYVCEEKEFSHSGCWRIKFNETYIYDNRQSVLQIGEYNNSLQCCKFLKNAYCQLDAQGILVCLLISNIKLVV